MSLSAISVEHLSKEYRLGQLGFQYSTLRDQLAGGISRLFGGEGDEAERPQGTIWALKDVSFEVEQGEVVGIVGRNGAGKTTLLKILSRITEPTRGQATFRGRLGSLLEVGTGFHPELTGRENVFLNGAILGMSKRETAGKFDEIVDFSGIETFIDTPVKRYSSGMYVRLAFAVAAHLEPEILLVDEVLAVGDFEFQKKCLGKMQDVGRSGRTVLFVSHSMPTVTRLCDRVILIEKGKVALDGPSEHVVARYLQSGSGTTAVREWADATEAPGTDWLKIRSIRVVNEQAEAVDTVDIRNRVGIETVFEVLGRPPVPITPMLAVHNDQGVHVFNALDPDPRWQGEADPGIYTSTAWIPSNLLNEGLMLVSVLLNTIVSGKSIKHATATEAVAFHSVDGGEGVSAKGRMTVQWGGAVSPRLEWTTQHSGARALHAVADANAGL